VSKLVRASSSVEYELLKKRGDTHGPRRSAFYREAGLPGIKPRVGCRPLWRPPAAHCLDARHPQYPPHRHPRRHPSFRLCPLLLEVLVIKAHVVLAPTLRSAPALPLRSDSVNAARVPVQHARPAAPLISRRIRHTCRADNPNNSPPV